MLACRQGAAMPRADSRSAGHATVAVGESDRRGKGSTARKNAHSRSDRQGAGRWLAQHRRVL